MPQDDTINTLITGIETSKSNIATAIEGKGVTVPSGTKLAGMASLINSIPTFSPTIVAPSYSSSSTYTVGQKVTYDGQLYKCNTAITTAEEWTAAHWTNIDVSGAFVDLDTNQTISGTKSFTNGLNVGNGSTNGGNIVGSSYNGFALKGNTSAGSSLEVQDSNGNISTSEPHTYFKINNSPSGATQLIFNNGYSSNLYRGTLKLPITGTTAKTLATTDDINDSIVNNIAPEYSASSTYTFGQKVIYDGQLYKCSVRIQSGEAWNSAKWTAIKVSSNFVDLDTAQTITGQKTFTSSVTLQQEPLRIDSDNHTTHTGDDWDAYYYSDKIEIYNNDSDNTGYLLFPDVGSNTETIATLSDIPAKSTDVNQFGDYYVSPTQVRQYQATLGIVQNDLLTNINGHSVSSLYEVDTNTSSITIGSKSYPVKKIINRSSGSILSFNEAHNYMRKMTGSEFTPIFDESVPQYTYIMDASGTLYKPQWDSTNGLVLWIMSAVSLKRYKHQIRIKQAYAQGGEPKIYFINNSPTAYTSYSNLWSALRHNVSELWVENSGGTISWRTVLIENSTIYWLGSSSSFMSQTINSSNFYQWEDVITQIDY